MNVIVPVVLSCTAPPSSKPVITRAILNDFSEVIAWFDGKTPDLLGTWDTLIRNAAVPVACHAGRP